MTTKAEQVRKALETEAKTLRASGNKDAALAVWEYLADADDASLGRFFDVIRAIDARHVASPVERATIAD